jgi:hypothetical protein
MNNDIFKSGMTSSSYNEDGYVRNEKTDEPCPLYHACVIYIQVFLTIFSIISLKTPNFFGKHFGLFGAITEFGVI